MNPKVCTALALMALAMDSAVATFILETTAAAGTATTISSASAASLGLLGGVVLLKGLVLGAAILSQRGRGKRSAENDDAIFFTIQAAEPAQCYKRLICDMATGTFPKSENDVIMQLFNEETPVESPKFEYTTAAKVGAIVKNVRTCEIRYSCPLSTQEMAKLFN